MLHNSFTFFLRGHPDWNYFLAFLQAFQTIKQYKSEITSSGHKRDLGLNVPEVKIT